MSEEEKDFNRQERPVSTSKLNDCVGLSWMRFSERTNSEYMSVRLNVDRCKELGIVDADGNVDLVIIKRLHKHTINKADYNIFPDKSKKKQ